MVDAVRQNEKVSEEKQKEINLVMYSTLIPAMIAITYLVFFSTGLQPEL